MARPSAPSDWYSEQVLDIRGMDQTWARIEGCSDSDNEPTVDVWIEDIAGLLSLQERLRIEGRWISGAQDLMGVLEVAYDEVKHCRVLRWLLDPSGGHGLGPRFLREFACDIAGRSAVSMDVDSLEGVSVVVEESREATRADIVLRTDSWTVLVEAKIRAGEQPNQGVRLESFWADEEPVLVFLTKSGRGIESGLGLWITYTWGDVSACLRRTLENVDAAAFGSVREYLKTLEAYFK